MKDAESGALISGPPVLSADKLLHRCLDGMQALREAQQRLVDALALVQNTLFPASTATPSEVLLTWGQAKERLLFAVHLAFIQMEGCYRQQLAIPLQTVLCAVDGHTSSCSCSEQGYAPPCEAHARATRQASQLEGLVQLLKEALHSLAPQLQTLFSSPGGSSITDPSGLVYHLRGETVAHASPRTAEEQNAIRFLEQYLSIAVTSVGAVEALAASVHALCRSERRRKIPAVPPSDGAGPATSPSRKGYTSEVIQSRLQQLLSANYGRSPRGKGAVGQSEAPSGGPFLSSPSPLPHDPLLEEGPSAASTPKTPTELLNFSLPPTLKDSGAEVAAIREEAGVDVGTPPPSMDGPLDVDVSPPTDVKSPRDQPQPALLKSSLSTAVPLAGRSTLPESPARGCQCMLTEELTLAASPSTPSGPPPLHHGDDVPTDALGHSSTDSHSPVYSRDSSLARRLIDTRAPSQRPSTAPPHPRSLLCVTVNEGLFERSSSSQSPSPSPPFRDGDVDAASYPHSPSLRLQELPPPFSMESDCNDTSRPPHAPSLPRLGERSIVPSSLYTRRKPQEESDNGVTSQHIVTMTASTLTELSSSPPSPTFAPPPVVEPLELERSGYSSQYPMGATGVRSGTVSQRSNSNPLVLPQLITGSNSRHGSRSASAHNRSDVGVQVNTILALDMRCTAATGTPHGADNDATASILHPQRSTPSLHQHESMPQLLLPTPPTEEWPADRDAGGSAWAASPPTARPSPQGIRQAQPPEDRVALFVAAQLSAMEERHTRAILSLQKEVQHLQEGRPEAHRSGATSRRNSASYVGTASVRQLRRAQQTEEVTYRDRCELESTPTQERCSRLQHDNMALKRRLWAAEDALRLSHTTAAAGPHPGEELLPAPSPAGLFGRYSHLLPGSEVEAAAAAHLTRSASAGVWADRRSVPRQPPRSTYDPPYASTHRRAAANHGASPAPHPYWIQRTPPGSTGPAGPCGGSLAHEFCQRMRRTSGKALSPLQKKRLELLRVARGRTPRTPAAQGSRAPNSPSSVGDQGTPLVQRSAVACAPESPSDQLIVSPLSTTITALTPDRSESAGIGRSSSPHGGQHHPTTVQAVLQSAKELLERVRTGTSTPYATGTLPVQQIRQDRGGMDERPSYRATPSFVDEEDCTPPPANADADPRQLSPCAAVTYSAVRPSRPTSPSLRVSRHSSHTVRREEEEDDERTPLPGQHTQPLHDPLRCEERMTERHVPMSPVTSTLRDNTQQCPRNPLVMHSPQPCEQSSAPSSERSPPTSVIRVAERLPPSHSAGSRARTAPSPSSAVTAPTKGSASQERGGSVTSTVRDGFLEDLQAEASRLQRQQQEVRVQVRKLLAKRQEAAEMLQAEIEHANRRSRGGDRNGGRVGVLATRQKLMGLTQKLDGVEKALERRSVLLDQKLQQVRRQIAGLEADIL